MRLTKKYIKATDLLTFPHKNQEQLYDELNRLGYYWDALGKKWVRDERLADPPKQTIDIRVWADQDFTEEHADVIVQLFSQNGYKLLNKSKSYPCRPPKQKESRIYLSFTDNQN
jgi:hypothetical protein